MKTYEETAQYILEVRNEHDRKVKRRKAAAMRVIPAAAGICGAVVICLAAVKNYRKPTDLTTDDGVITGVTVSVVTTVPQSTEEAVTTLTQAVKTPAGTTVSATSVTATDVAAVTEQTSTKTTYAATAAAVTAVRTTAAAPSVTVTTTVEAVTTTVTTQEITAGPIIAGGGSGNGNGNEGGDWDHGGYSGEGSGFGGYGGGGGFDCGGFGEGDSGGTGSGVKAGSENSSEEQWKQLPINEKYCYAYIYGYDRVYTSLYPITPDYAGEWIDSAEMLGSQMIEGQEMKCGADVYSVIGITDTSAVAIKFEGNDGYYLYYKPNADLYNIMNTVPQAE
jgi:hypothetical protein